MADAKAVRERRSSILPLLAESRPTVASTDWVPPAYLDPDRQSDDRWGRLTLCELRQELEGFLKH